MSDQEKQIQQLKQHFGRRVVDQARVVIDLWQRLPDEFWKSSWFNRILDATDRLYKFADRFQQQEILTISEQLLAYFNNTGSDKVPDSQVISDLEDLLNSLARLVMRRNDQDLSTDIHLVKKPLYILLKDPEQRVHIQTQLQNFGFHVMSFDSVDEFKIALSYRYPSSLLIDVDFGGPAMGIDLVEEVQQHLDPKIPVLFYSENALGIETRLRCLRAGGIDYKEGKLDIIQVVELFEQSHDVTFQDACRVLVIEDSRTQSLRTVRTLNNAGMITQPVLNPLKVLEVMEEFDTEVILMDMYMPQCSGIELAALIRQDRRYDSIPIIYLSAEDDVSKQLNAMARGGDDFLNKSVSDAYLIGAIRNRANRSRILKARMSRDSLTGLLDHSNLLQQLVHERSRAVKTGSGLCFAMLDIDRFKGVNDHYGHDVGDKIIKSLALFLRQRLRKTDTLGRYGGEEFGIILPDTTLDNAVVLFEEILANFSLIQHGTSKGDIQITFSGGIASIDQVGVEDKMSRLADLALYKAKEQGRNQICRYIPGQS